MKIFFSGLLVICLAVSSQAEVQIIDGVPYVCEEGICRPVEALDDIGKAAPAEEKPEAPRIAQGYLDADAFVAFLKGVEKEEPSHLFLLLLAILLGGLAMNLTPCVLPMVPVNLILIGRSVRRGLLYALGIIVAYGLLGLLTALGGVAFGTIQSSPWFNGFVSILFVALACSLFGAFNIDLARFRPRLANSKALLPFGLGLFGALLAGACVAPALVSVLVLATRLQAEGNPLALALPFVFAFGMALPWPFLAAGFKVLPRPGPWMRWINRLFALLILAFAAWYGKLAVLGWYAREGVSDGTSIRPAELPTRLQAARALGKPILVDCGASWCKNCAAMEGVLKEPKVQEELKRFTVIRLQAEDLSELRRQPGCSSILGLPAFLIFTL